MTLLGDFHVHSNFCPHGSNDTMESYVQAAIEKKLKYLTFTEHAPLPRNFIDPVPDQNSAMKWDDLASYLSEANYLKRKYQNKININVGFEIDYIEDYEEELEEFLNQIGEYAYHSILSVHMLKAPNNEYVCIDFSTQEFERIISLFGSVDNVYDAYYRTVQKALSINLGIYRPKRIGHITLIEKFSKIFQPNKSFQNEWYTLLEIIKRNNFELDANTAGFYKEWCGTSYPNQSIISKAQDLDIPLVFGSDSHTAQHIARGADRLQQVTLSLPNHC